MNRLQPTKKTKSTSSSLVGNQRHTKQHKQHGLKRQQQRKLTTTTIRSKTNNRLKIKMNTKLHTSSIKNMSTYDSSSIPSFSEQDKMDFTTPMRYPLSTHYSTGISGLPAIPNGRDVLESLYVHTLDLAKDYSRKTGQFIYESVQNTTLYRLRVLRQYPDDDDMVERVIGSGQIEELIEAAEEELTLLDSINTMKQYSINYDLLKGAASPFGSEDPRCETRIFPLPQAVADEVATGKVSINPYHPTKPLSRKFIQHLGFGDLITKDEHTMYDELLTLTDEDKIQQEKNLNNISGIVRDDISATLLINQSADPLSNEYFEFFNTSYTVHPELDTKTVEDWTNAYEIHVRKL